MIIRGRRFRVSRFTLHMMRTAFERTLPATPDYLHTQIGSDDVGCDVRRPCYPSGAMEGSKILTDPNFVPRVIVPKRLVEPGIPIHQLPPLDLIVVSHAHFDHLVKPSLRQLAKDVPIVVPTGLADLITPLGFRRVYELNWWEVYEGDGFKVIHVPANHWGRRTPRDRDRGYGGFVIKRQGHHVYFAGIPPISRG